MRDLSNGDVVWSEDLYKEGDAGRPLLVVGNAEMADHGMQFVCVNLTSRTYHDHSIAIDEGDYENAPLPLESHALPWVFQTVSREHVQRYVTSITDEKHREITNEARSYLGRDA